MPTYNLQQFGQLIKQKHPEYSDMADEQVAQKVLTKYPQYSNMVTDASSHAFNPNNPQAQQNLSNITRGSTQSMTGNLVMGAITGVKNYGQNVAKHVYGNAENMVNSIQQVGNTTQAAQNQPLSALKSLGNMLLQNTGEAVDAVFAPISEALKPTIKGDANALASTSAFSKAANSKTGDAVQKTQNAYMDWSAKNPNKAKDFDAALSTIMALSGEGPANKLSGIVSDTAKPAADILSAVADNARQTASDVKGKVTSSLQDRYVGQAKADWQQPVNTPKPAYNKATQIYSKAASGGHDISDTLIKNKMNVADHLDNGVYQTIDAADQLHADASQMSNSMLRPALQKANPGVPRVPVSELVAEAEKNIRNNSTLTSDRKDGLIANLEKSKASMEAQYPQGLALTDLHDEKIVRDLNSKYSPIGDIGTDNEALKNKAIADASRKMLEVKAPRDIGVHEFNAELAKQHQAADYLAALNNKKAPITLGASIRKGLGKAIGAKLGTLAGGGIMGGVAGYHVGGMVESLLEQIPNPLKQHFLQNLEATNPEAFSKVKNYLDNAQVIPVGAKGSSVATPADLGNAKLPGAIRVNNYQSKFPKYLAPDQIQNAKSQSTTVRPK